MHHRRFLYGFVLFMFAALSVAAQTARFPATDFGRIAEGWLKVINEGSEAEMKAFVENNFSPAALREKSVAETVFLMDKLRRQSGGLEVVSVAAPAGPFAASITVKTRRGGQYAHLNLGESRREPNKISGFGFGRVAGPGAATGLSWPERKLSESEMIEEIKRRVAQRAGEGKFSGVVLVARDDRILLRAAHGLAERSFNVPNSLQTKFNLASVGKMFTATAVAQLVAQGKIAYDDKLVEHLPDFPDRAAAEKITIHQLLTHTAGLGTLFDSPDYDRLRRYRGSWDAVSAFADEPLFFEPGARWRYSNAGYVTLGAVIERVSGMNYVDYVRERIFEPLGMNDTSFYAHDEVVPHKSVLYVQSPDDPLGHEPYVADHILGGYRGNAEGGGYSTAPDLFKFARSYRTAKLLGREAQERLYAKLTDEDGRGLNFWGYGVKQTVSHGETVRGHSGGGRSHLQMLWNSGYTVIVQTNTVPPSVTALSNEIVNFMTKQISLREKK